MSSWENKLLNEVRDDVKSILSNMGKLATKEELEVNRREITKLKQDISRFKTIYNTVVVGIVVIWAVVQSAIKYVGHG